MTPQDELKLWAIEINKDWTLGYKADNNGNSLIVTFKSEEVARINYNNGRYTVTGADKDAVGQLEYIVSQ